MRRLHTGIGMLMLTSALAVIAVTPASAASRPDSRTQANTPSASRSAPVGGAAKQDPAALEAKAAAMASRAQSTPQRTVGVAHLDGACNTGDLCLWYLSNFTGSRVDFYDSDRYLWDNRFLTAGSGQGQIVANNAESDWNYDPSLTAWVCTGVNYTGSCGFIRPNTGGNLNSTYRNNVESFYWAY